MPPNPLEYEEESEGYDDLFGSDPETDNDPLFVDTRVPVHTGWHKSATSAAAASPALHAQPQPAAGPSRERTWPTVDQRIEELRRLRARPSLAPERGVPSLRAFAMRVVRMNSSRIWDVSDMQYRQLAEFLDEVPRDQLSEIEEASPHLLKDTDWLWEGFVLQEFPLFHEKCRSRRGAPRTSGWRRMYAKATVEAAERQRMAAERMRQRYAEHDADRQKRKVVQLDTFIAPEKGRSRAAYSMSTARRGAKAAAAYAPTTKVQSALNKARMDSQRARRALTHASGKYIPPPPAKRASTSTGPTAYSNPYPVAPAKPVEPKVNGPRLPPPRLAAPKTTKATVEAERFPGSHRTDPAARKSLPEHIKPSSDTPSRDVYRQSEGGSRLRDIHKPKTQNFDPDAEKKKNKTTHLDFFGKSGAGPSTSKVSVSVKKRSAHETEDVGAAAKRPRTSASASGAGSAAPETSSSRLPSGTPAVPTPPRTSTPTSPQPRDLYAGIRPTATKRAPPRPQDVLFAKKRKAPFRTRP